jgi:hypothetical protein
LQSGFKNAMLIRQISLSELRMHRRLSSPIQLEIPRKPHKRKHQTSTTRVPVNSLYLAKIEAGEKKPEPLWAFTI